ncbi:MAG: Lrp/AsnC family transcriptional regulator [Euryarchaeota archaeon]|nr:Lrp/AsnC family transcriptional regulator [Euryarchaeota archaeon]
MEEIEERTLGLIRRSKGGILQNQLRLELGVDGRRCARIVRTLLDAKFVGRELVTAGGVRVYRIRFTGGVRKYDLLIAGRKFDPCVGCIDDCDPARCAQLNKWIKELGVSL